jgi:diaminopimelate epimerase
VTPSVSFLKVHGAGNDFVLIDQVEPPDPPEPLNRIKALPGVAADGTPLAIARRETEGLDPLPAAAVAWCDRHRGVGADGLLLVRRDMDGGWRMRIMNADGSIPEMCGNGIRCVARYLVEHRGQGVARADLPREVCIRTDAGPRTCRVFPESSGPWQVTVNMGAAEVAGADERLEIDGRVLPFRRVATGNPHAVLLSDDPAGDAERLGALVERDPSFPDRTNVEFVSLEREGSVRVVVHERGCGITQACGTGATAVAAALIAQGTHDPARALDVHLPGGLVTIQRDAENELFMTGPAAVVFMGMMGSGSA